MTTLILACLLQGESTSFEVEVPAGRSVSYLKDLIKEKNPNTLEKVRAKDLTLWRVSIPIVLKKDRKEIFLKDVASPTELDETAKISHVFDAKLPEDTIHIIIQPPKSVLKRGRDQSPIRVIKRFIPSGTVNMFARKFQYYADQSENNESLVEKITCGQYVRVYGARASGKSSRIVDAMNTLTEKHYQCIYVDFQSINVSSEVDFWSSLNQYFVTIGFDLNLNGPVSFREAFSTVHKRWDDRRPVIIFFDEFDKLHLDTAVHARNSMLSAIRGLKNSPHLPSGDLAHMIHSIVSIGTYAIKLIQTNSGLSPFNIIDDFQNTGLSLDQVRMLYDQFAVDRGITIVDEVMNNIFSETRGHAGLVNVCGVAMEASLDSRPHGSVVDTNHWASVRNILLTEMERYGTFQRLVSDLTQISGQQQSALGYYRNHFLGNTSDRAVKDNRQDSLAEYLAALGVLYPVPAQAKTFKIASPLMDSFIRQMVIPHAFPNAPNTPPPRRPNGTLDILEIIRSSLRLFDKDFVNDAVSSSFKTAPVCVNNSRNMNVPKESVYDSEMTRICMNWLASRHGYQVIGQYHIANLFCDIVIQYDKQLVALELVATETAKQIEKHVTRTVKYKQLLKANEGWVIHFTRQDNYLQDPCWPKEADFDQGINVIHIWHDQGFTEVRLSAKWKSEDGRMMTVEDERVI
ncbi:hypothetical protein BGZ65_001811 [Modicella reniformis]|uniref:Crinkler effector protein N-terminal domain-containing protein n=1 Tax=Modicella reniformis TaxID=1440133 RepID=A0A9P6J3N2_9FUNG|nr:hypothetical protein BGZ65_001811 [Modicella reniformis]